MDPPRWLNPLQAPNRTPFRSRRLQLRNRHHRRRRRSLFLSRELRTRTRCSHQSCDGVMLLALHIRRELGGPMRYGLSCKKNLCFLLLLFLLPPPPPPPPPPFYPFTVNLPAVQVLEGPELPIAPLPYAVKATSADGIQVIPWRFRSAQGATRRSGRGRALSLYGTRLLVTTELFSPEIQSTNEVD